MKEEYYVIPITPVMTDDIIHDDEHPFCSDPECPCHNQDAFEEHLLPGLSGGLLTGAEALRLYWNQ